MEPVIYMVFDIILVVKMKLSGTSLTREVNKVTHRENNKESDYLHQDSSGDDAFKITRSFRKCILPKPRPTVFRKYRPQDVDTYMKPLRHLKGREVRRYTNLNELSTNGSRFKMLLEVFNRRAVRPIRKQIGKASVDMLSDYFFECVGQAGVSSRHCTQCCDVNKSHIKYDWYFIDLVEISQERTVLCLDCMTSVVNKHVQGDMNSIKEELNRLRKKQPCGVYIDSYLISCGY